MCPTQRGLRVRFSFLERVPLAPLYESCTRKYVQDICNIVDIREKLGSYFQIIRDLRVRTVASLGCRSLREMRWKPKPNVVDTLHR